jgi:hypothetical protein
MKPVRADRDCATLFRVLVTHFTGNSAMSRPLLLLEDLLQNFLGDSQHEPGWSGSGLRRKGSAKLQ